MNKSNFPDNPDQGDVVRDEEGDIKYYFDGSEWLDIEKRVNEALKDIAKNIHRNIKEEGLKTTVESNEKGVRLKKRDLEGKVDHLIQKVAMHEGRIKQLEKDMNEVDLKDEQEFNLNCKKCKYLSELYESIENPSNRDYWLMTELFVMLHGKDYCEAGK